MKYCVDANVFISAWDANYKDTVFPSLWVQLISVQDSIILVKQIFDEISPVSNWNTLSSEDKEKYPLRNWLIRNNFENSKENLTDEVEQFAVQLEEKYGITPESDGAGLNDIRLIAYAKQTNNCVVTEESYQDPAPQKLSNWRIPIICEEEDVKCLNFVGMLEALEISI